MISEYGYIETGTIADGLIPARVIELQRGQYTVICDYGETTASLKGTFFRDAEQNGDFP